MSNEDGGDGNVDRRLQDQHQNFEIKAGEKPEETKERLDRYIEDCKRKIKSYERDVEIGNTATGADPALINKQLAEAKLPLFRRALEQAEQLQKTLP